jgi:hypothetical protein
MNWKPNRYRKHEPMRRLILFANLLILAGFAVGCGENRFSLDKSVKGLFGADDETPEEMASRLFDEKDPDARREGIEMLSRKSWALDEPYLKRFATLTQPANESDPNVRAVAVRTLGRASDRKYMREIISALDDPAVVVRWDAAVVLTEMPSEKATRKLEWLAINDDSVDVRAAAAKALRHYREDEVYRTLLRCLADEDFLVRCEARDSLVFMTGQDRGYDPVAWVDDPAKLGRESLPEPVVRYKKKPWWDWFGVTAQTESIRKEEPEDKRPWWDWLDVTTEDASETGRVPQPKDHPTSEDPPIVSPESRVVSP